MMENPVRSKSPLSSFFRFKNQETEVEILKILNSYEGVFEEEAAKYLNFAHSVIKAELFVEVKTTIRIFWKNHPELPFSDVLGLFEMVLGDMQHDIITKGDEFVKEMRRKR